MSANSKMVGEQLKFQQRWEYRRGDSDFDSSSNESEYSLGGEPAHKKHKLALVTVDNDETSEVSRFQQKGKNDTKISGQIELGVAKKGKRAKRKKENLAHNKNKRGSHSQKEISQKKGKAIANESAALDDLKNYMNSLLEELKVTRKNLLSWMREEMQKLVAEEKECESERKECNLKKGEKVQLQSQKNPEENAQSQYQNLFGKNIRVQHQHNLEEYSQLQNQSKFQENVQMQHLINLEENLEALPQKNSQEKVQLMHRNRVRSCTGARNCNGGPSKRLSKSKKSADSNNHTPSLEDQADYSRAIVLVAPTEEERLLLSDKSNSKSSSSQHNVQVQQQKSIVLAIKAQNGNSGYQMKSAKGKKAANSDNHCQLPSRQFDYGQAIGTLASAEKVKGERSGLSMERKFSSDSFNHAASSMYLTLPSVLANPHIANHRPDTSPCSYLQHRSTQNQPGISSERSNLILGSSTHLGYFQGMLPEERNRNYLKMSSRDIGFFNQNSTSTSIVGSGFTVPLQTGSGGFSFSNQFDLENLPRESNNTLGLTMNGGAIRFSGGGFSLPESYIANNFHSLSNYIADGRLTTYEDGYRFPK